MVFAVTISIYNANNKRVKLVTKSSASGGYSYAWNGRNGKGDVLPAGKYRIVQKLVDEFGTTKSFTNYANLSRKKLVTLTKTITKNGSAIAAQLGNVAESGGTLRVKARSGGASGGGVIYPGMTSRTDDQRIARVRPLLSPAVLAEDLPMSAASAALINWANGVSLRISTAPATTAMSAPSAGSTARSASTSACAVSLASPPTGRHSPKSLPLSRPAWQPRPRST